MELPLQFYHHGYDWQIRDARLRPVLRINIEGLDFIQQKNVIDFCEGTVKLWNNRDQVVIGSMTPERAMETAPEIKVTVPLSVEDIAGNGVPPNGEPLKKRRGNPNWFKGMKRGH